MECFRWKTYRRCNRTHGPNYSSKWRLSGRQHESKEEWPAVRAPVEAVQRWPSCRYSDGSHQVSVNSAASIYTQVRSRKIRVKDDKARGDLSASWWPYFSPIFEPMRRLLLVLPVCLLYTRITYVSSVGCCSCQCKSCTSLHSVTEWAKHLRRQDSEPNHCRCSVLSLTVGLFIILSLIDFVFEHFQWSLLVQMSPFSSKRSSVNCK